MSMSLNEAISNTVILHEYTTKSGLTYIGKTKNLLKAEKIIDKLINSDKGKDADLNKISKFNRSKDLKELEKCFKDEFGFKEMFISIFSETIEPNGTDDSGKTKLDIITRNAYTNLPPLIIRDSLTGMPEPLFKKDKFYDYKHTYLCDVTITADRFDGTFTAEEVMAVILHEIGHNFDVALSTYAASALNSINIVKLFTEGKYLATVVQLFPNIFHGMFQKVISQAISKIPVLSIATEIFARFWNFVIDRSSFLVLPNILGVLSIFSKTNPRQILYSQLMFNAERFADSFATIYGYGPALISWADKEERLGALQDDLDNVMNRMSFSKKEKKEGKKDFKKYNNSTGWRFAKNWTWAGSAIVHALCCFLDPHPATQTRCKMALEDCKKLSENKDFPPAIRAALKKDYENAKKQYDTYMGLNKDDKQAFIAKITKAFNENVFGGKMDLRSYIFRCSAIQSGALNPTKKK